MGLQRTDAPLGPPVERFKYPHFFLSTGQHFNSRGARVRQGRAEALPFVYEFPRFVSGGALLGTGVGWLSLKESHFENTAYAVDRPMVGRLGCNGGLARVQFPTSGLSGSCESVVANLETQTFAGKQTLSESTVSLGFWTDGILPTPRCLYYDESGSRVFIASRAGRRGCRTLWWDPRGLNEVGRDSVASTRQCRLPRTLTEWTIADGDNRFGTGLY